MWVEYLHALCIELVYKALSQVLKHIIVQTGERNAIQIRIQQLLASYLVNTAWFKLVCCHFGSELYISASEIYLF